MTWDAPQTEEGLQQTLERLRRCQSEGDDLGVGNGSLTLAHLVKWVRSDTDAPPFVRSHQLALQALDAFRRAGYAAGQVRALMSASAMADRRSKEAMLSEAETLAATIGDDNLTAAVIAARARSLAMSDRVQATALTRRALEIYRRSGNRGGQAQCLFSLAIYTDSDEEEIEVAMEAASIYRNLGNPGEAARSLSLAFMAAKKLRSLPDLETLARQGLQDALDAGNRSLEKGFYEDLAFIFVAKGDHEGAETYRRWATDLQDADGLTPLERWEHDVEMTKMIIEMAKAQGSAEAVKTFRAELRRLKRSKPSTD